MPGPDPDVRLVDDDTVVVEARVPVAPAEAWRAVCERERLAQWLGTLTADLDVPGDVRLELDDGDFFEIEDVQLDPAQRRVRWRWRFMGCAPSDDVEITVAPAGAEAKVAVRDRQPRRGRTASLELGSGWRDFTSRLQRHLATGERSRYDWRRDVDVWMQLPVDAAAARRLLIAHAARWLPLRGGADLFSAQSLALDDDAGDDAHRLAIAGVTPAGPGAVRFTARPEPLRQATTCLISISPRGDASMLAVHHTGFDALDADDDRRRDWRERSARAWLAAAWRAHRLVAGEDRAHDVVRVPAPRGDKVPVVGGAACPLHVGAGAHRDAGSAASGCPLRRLS